MEPLSSVLRVPLGPASGDDMPGAMTKKTNVFNRTRIREIFSPHSCTVLLHTDSTFPFFFFLFFNIADMRQRICAFATSSSVSEPTRRCFQIISHTLWPEQGKQNFRTRRKKVLLKNTSLHKINKNKKKVIPEIRNLSRLVHAAFTDRRLHIFLESHSRWILIQYQFTKIKHINGTAAYAVRLLSVRGWEGLILKWYLSRNLCYVSLLIEDLNHFSLGSECAFLMSQGHHFIYMVLLKGLTSKISTTTTYFLAPRQG